MHLIGCVRKGVPLPELPTRTAKRKMKKSKARPPPADNVEPKGVGGINGPIEAAKSPRRRSRLESLVGSADGDGPRTTIPESNELGIREVLHNLAYSHECCRNNTYQFVSLPEQGTESARIPDVEP